MNLKRSLLVAATAAMITPMAAQATNGYFAHGYGAKSKGMAGAGVALPQSAMATATNPAGMVWVGNRMDAGVALFSPNRKYVDPNNALAGFGAPAGTGGQESDSNYFLVPHFARNWMQGGDRSFGVAVYGNGGMNTDYSNGVFGGAAGIATGVNLMQLFIAPTWSMKIDDKTSWGISPIIAFQAFEARGLQAFSGQSSSSGNLTNRQHDKSYGMGLRLGYQTQLNDRTTFGIAATTKIYMTEFDKYKGLFAEQGDFDIPANITAGIAMKMSDKSVLTFDIQHIAYSGVKSIANPIANLAPGGQQLGTNNGGGFGWDDMTIVKIGYQWQASDDLTMRVGISHGKQPIPSSEVIFNILAPAVMETHLTFGFTKKTGKNSELNFAAMYSPSNSVTGTSPFTGAAPLTIEMDQFEFELSWGWTF